MAGKQFIKSENFTRLVAELSKNYNVYFPELKGEKLHFIRYNNGITSLSNEDISYISLYRTFEPLKNFFFKAREVVAEDFKDEYPGSGEKPYCIIGVKSCDLKGFLVQDHVFLNHDYRDPSYIYNREKNLIISIDCTAPLDTCFCIAMGLNPYPEENFDLNLSPVDKDFIVDIGSPKGEEIVNNYSSLFENSTPEKLDKQNITRSSAIKRVEENIKKYEIPGQDNYSGIIKKNYEENIWKDEASTCVECGACNTICPTCHCFLLYDQKDEEEMARFRVWDSCLIKDFALIAAGANPRPFLWMRLRNRFEKKFDYFPKVANFYACTGCGRCISACPGKIDIRRILKRLVDNVQK